MNISEAMSICFKNKTKVYPIVFGRKFKIQIDVNGQKTTYREILSSKELGKKTCSKYISLANEYLKQ